MGLSSAQVVKADVISAILSLNNHKKEIDHDQNDSLNTARYVGLCWRR